VILYENKQKVASVDDLEERLAGSEDSALLLIRRSDATVFVPLKRPAS
jgi:hypothetical protein